MIRDPQGYAALPFATYSLQNILLTDGPLAALQVESPLVSFVLGKTSESAVISAELSLEDGSTVSRTLTLTFVEDQWRVETVAE